MVDFESEFNPLMNETKQSFLDENLLNTMEYRPPTISKLE
jgi:hypothetical protein